MLDKQLVFNIFAHTGNYEAYLLYKELKNAKSKNENTLLKKEEKTSVLI